MATEDEHPGRPDIAPDIAAMLTDQTRACKAARDAIAAGGQVVVWDNEVPHWRVAGIAAARLRWSLKRGLTTIGLDETVEILAQHRDGRLRTGIIDAADRSWHFTLYLNAAGTELWACSGVKRESPSKVGDQKLQL
ncbi:hypothetical protein OG819_53205 [Streptomyces sp. NBC_01549]|uniref:hypothetical protein n=1 Tax=unclassified Streptomyces TaxID=2593676 RepID=UPI002254D01E|nr:hypothetical protein [Streptomyces sp. NBC_01549]MCX4597973.1 hypothetical protein [Streptomyces sp. NBC_01549]